MKKLRVILGLFLAALILTSCGKGRVRPTGGLFGATAEGGMFGERDTRGTTQESNRRASSGEAADLPDEILGVRIDNKHFDFPVVYNSKVEFWIRHFAFKAKNHFQIYLDRKADFEPIIRPHLEVAGAPQDLIYLAMIESGFSTRARSWASAVGVWQFIRSTGKHYGLKINWWVDERRDPYKATKAAIEMLTRLHGEFDSWELAAAAYNGGPARVRKAVNRHGTRDFWRLTRTRSLRRETKNYVPKIMAAAIISKNAHNFGFRKSAPRDTWTNTSSVMIPRAETLIGLATASGVSLRTIKKLNPELLRRSTPPSARGYRVRLPNGAPIANLTNAIQQNKIGTYKTFKRYVIRRGDTLSQIAYRYGLNSRSIMTFNGLRSARSLRPGQSLLLPIPRSARPKRRMSAAREIATRKTYYDKRKGVLFYKVKKGDTLYDISRKYDVSVRQIKRWNRIARHKNLRPGRHLKLYVKNDTRNRRKKI